MMDESKPQWEWLVVQNVGSLTIRIFRFHHSYLDGGSIALLLGEKLLQFKSGNPQYIFHPMQQKEGFRAKFYKLLGYLALPMILVKDGGEQVNGRKDQLLSYSKGTKGHNFCISNNGINSSVLRQLKCKYGASVNSIISSAAVAAVAKVCPEKIGDFIKLGIPLPIFPYPNTKPQNRTSLILFGAEKVKNSQSYISILSSPNQGVGFIANFYILRIIGRLPLSFIRAGIKKGAGISTIIVNMPFTRNLGILGDCEINEIRSWTILQPPSSISITSHGYMDQVEFSCTSAKAVYSREESQSILDFLVELLQQMLEDKENWI